MSSTGIISKVLRDHKNINACYEKYKNSASHREVQKMWKNELIVLVAQHSIAEELVLYPLLDANIANGVELHKHDVEEHGKIKRLMASIDKDSVDVKEEQKTMQEIITNFHHHQKEEEETQLPTIQNGMTDTESEHLGKQFELSKGASPTPIRSRVSDTWDRLRDFPRILPEDQELKKVIEV